MNALPPSLDRFGEELENAVHRDLGSRRTRRRVVRSAAVLAVAAATALGLLSALPTGGPSVVKRAAAALAADDSILHFRMNALQQNGDGTTASWHSETWQLLVAPYTRRQIEVDGSGGIRAESVSSGDTTELYDSSDDTIYITTGQELRAARTPTIEIVSKSRLQKLVHNPKVATAYRLVPGTNRPVVVTTKEGAKRFREQIAREAANTDGVPEDFRSDILALLQSGKVQVVGHVTVGGRDAIKLESSDGKQVYIVDATTYDPIEWTSTGTDGGVTLRFPVYEKLAVDDQSTELLSLQAQHPGAKVVRDVHAYMSAESRLYPHG